MLLFYPFSGAKVRNKYELWIMNYVFFLKNLRNSKEMSTFAPQIVEKVTNK